MVRARGFRARWRTDQRGTTAIEFMIVAMPFFMFCFGVMGAGLSFFTSNSLEHGVETAARKIRTGEMQKATTANTMGDFKNSVCASAGTYINCSKLSILMQTGTTWSAITPQSCLSSGSLTVSTGSSGSTVSTYSGGAGAVVLITACYEWELPKTLPSFLTFLHSNPTTGGSQVMQAVATFRTEPYQ